MAGSGHICLLWTEIFLRTHKCSCSLSLFANTFGALCNKISPISPFFVSKVSIRALWRRSWWFAVCWYWALLNKTLQRRILHRQLMFHHRQRVLQQAQLYDQALQDNPRIPDVPLTMTMRKYLRFSFPMRVIAPSTTCARTAIRMSSGADMAFSSTPNCRFVIGHKMSNVNQHVKYTNEALIVPAKSLSNQWFIL